MERQRSSYPHLSSLLKIASAGWLFSLLGCHMNDEPIVEYHYECGDAPAPEPTAPRCGEGDPRLPPEPTLPPDPTDPNCILKASRIEPPEGQVLDEPLEPAEALKVLDTVRINTALRSCSVVKLIKDGERNAFLSGNFILEGTDPNGSKTLWIDEGVTLFQSRNPTLFQQTGNCGAIGINDSSACIEFITVRGTRPALVGRGTIDGQGGEPMVGKDYSWWEASYALR